MFGKALWKNRLFLGGFIFLIVLVGASFYYSAFIEDEDRYTPIMLFDEDGSIIAQAPYSPSWRFPLGSDQFGDQMLYILIDGAKYTISYAVCIAVFSVLIAIVCGLLLSYLPNRLNFTIREVFGAFHFMPLAVFAYLLITPVIKIFEWSYDPATKLLFPFYMLVVLSIPIITVYVSNEVREILKKEFIVNAKVLGGGRFHVFWKHAVPYVMPKLLVIFTQHIGRVLMVLAQLGLLKVFIGGGVLKTVGHKKGLVMTDDGPIWGLVPVKDLFSASHEWAGLIGRNWTSFSSSPWVVLGPVTAFALTIIAVNFMAEGMNESLGEKRRFAFKKSNRNRNADKGNTGGENFEFVGNGISPHQ